MTTFDRFLRKLGFGRFKRLLLTRKLKKYGEVSYKINGTRYSYIVIGG